MFGKALAVFCMLYLHSTNAVTELDDNSFFNFAAKKQVLLVNFYAPWCGDCTALAPHFEGAASSLGPRSTDLAKVDCFGAGKGLCEMYSVKSWPQLKSFHNGNYNGDYTGPQTASDIANYINTVENSAPQVAPEQPSGNPYAGLGKQPLTTSISCAKCKIEKPQGKIHKDCSSALKKACIAQNTAATKSTTNKKPKLTKAQQKYGADDK